MQQEIVYTRWIEIDGTNGITFVPFDMVYSNPNLRTMNPAFADVQGLFLRP